MRTLPPHTLTVEQFTGRAHDMRTAARYGDPIPALVMRARSDHQRLDPLDTALAAPARSEVLFVGLGHVASIVGRTGKKMERAGVANKLSMQLPRDRMVTALQSGNGSLVAEALPDLVAMEDRLAAMRQGKLSHGEILRRLDHINIRHARLSADAFLDQRLGYPGTEVIARAQTAGLIVQSVDLLQEVAHEMNAYENARRNGNPTPRQHGQNSHFAGHAVELMYFSYTLARQYKAGQGLTVGTRMALTREDAADTRGYTPSPNFDLMVNGRPVQIKYGGAANGVYDPEISVGHLPTTNLGEDVPIVSGWLSTTVNPSASPGKVNDAWLNLERYFEPIDRQIQAGINAAG